jgi:Phasin protein
MTDRFDFDAWMENYKDTFTSFTKAQQEGFRTLERFARFNYAVAGDCLEAGLAQVRAVLSARASVGTQVVADLLSRQAELSKELSEKLRARTQEFSSLASEVQESVSNFAADAAGRAASGPRKAAEKH